jgi:hypothetical protein
MFDALVDEMRTHSTEWLRREHEELIAQQRRLRTREMAVLRVLDERGLVDVSIGSDGESARVVRDKVETARALESLPAIGAVAVEGGFSDEQLTQVVRVADEGSDAEWAARAPNVTPADLSRLARQRSKPTVEDGQARHAARELWMKWDDQRAMLRFGGELPDVLGAKVEATVKKLAEQLSPVKGQPWEPWRRRAADALGLMCDAVEAAERIETPMAAPSPLIAVDVPEHGPAELCGIPLPDAMVEQLRASASIEPVLVDDQGFPVMVGRRARSLSPKIVRAVLLRDGHCRCGNCDLRFGLHAHHLRPRSWGGTDELSNLAAVASVHHPLLIPNGPYALVGNPNLPDGLRMVHIDDLTPDEAQQVGLPSRRAGPNAA